VRSISWEASGYLASQKTPQIYGTRRFITISSEASLLSSSWATLIRSVYQDIFNANFNIILQLRTVSLRVFPSDFQFTHQNPMHLNSVTLCMCVYVCVCVCTERDRQKMNQLIKVILLYNYNCHAIDDSFESSHRMAHRAWFCKEIQPFYLMHTDVCTSVSTQFGIEWWAECFHL